MAVLLAAWLAAGAALQAHQDWQHLQPAWQQAADPESGIRAPTGGGHGAPAAPAWPLGYAHAQVQDSPFVTIWETTSSNENVTIPGTGTYTIDWGDGTPSTSASGIAPHTYANPGNHTVSISGGLEKINLGITARTNAQKLQSIDQWGGIKWTSMDNAFNSASAMTYAAIDAPDLSRVTSMGSMFSGASSFNGNISGWNVSQVDNMNSMFNAAADFNQPLSRWNVSQVTDMSRMFYGATSFNQNISGWDVSQVAYMDDMFSGATSFDQNLGNWYVVPEDTAYAVSERTLNVTTISAQNHVLDRHSPEYGIGSGDGANLFNMTGSTLMFKDTPSAQNYTVTVTAPGGDFGTGNSRTLTVMVTAGADTISPVITLNGANPDSVPVGANYTDPGYSCADGVDGTLTPTITSTVDTSTPGTYTCTDSSGNESTAIREVRVVDAGADTTPPTITLDGPPAVTVTASTAFDDPGVTCTDETDLNPSLDFDIVDIDLNTPGDYTVTYTCTDSSGNTSFATWTVTVVAAGADTTPPVITLDGANPDYVPVGSGSYYYSEPGVTCTDETDLNPLLVSNRTGINLGSPGTYTVTYICTDSSDNESTATRTVIVEAADNTPPTITLNGANPETIPIGVNYVDPAYCTDDTDPAPSLVSDAAGFDVDFLGTYTITYTIIYTCTDSSGNESTATREVRVVDAGADPPEDNSPPNVNAGEDQTVGEGDTVTLSGSAADPDSGDSIESYSWSAPSGSGITLADGSSASTTFTAPAVEVDTTFTFTLTASDGEADGSDDVVVTVRDSESNAPTADAGPDQTVNEGDAVTLDGSGSSDPNNDPLAYSWSQTSGQQVALAGADTASPTFTAPTVAAGTDLVFTLNVTAGSESHTDTVAIAVRDSESNAPTADAGPDQTVNEGDAVTLDGSGSSDPNNDPLAYSWSQTSGQQVALAGADTASPTFTAPTVAAGTDLVFTLNVTAGSESHTDTVAIAVRDSESNAPTADAGPDQTVNEGDAVTLDGSGSSDPNNDPLAYSWSQTSGQQVALAGADTASPTFTAPTVAAGTDLVFTLNVTAGSESHTDTVAIAVRDSESNAPTADAGPDQTVNEGDAVTLDGSGSSDPNNDPLAYSWSQTSGQQVALAGADTASPTFTAPTVAAGTDLVFTLNVTAGSESHTDTVAIAVRDSESNAPTADAGPDQTVNEGDAVTLDGSGSSDPNNDALEYFWEYVTGQPPLALSGAAAERATFAAPHVEQATDLEFRLTVRNTDGNEGTDTVTVKVRNGENGPPADPPNRPPRVDARGPASVVEGDTATLAGMAAWTPTATDSGTSGPRQAQQARGLRSTAPAPLRRLSPPRRSTPTPPSPSP